MGHELKGYGYDIQFVRLYDMKSHTITYAITKTMLSRLWVWWGLGSCSAIFTGNQSSRSSFNLNAVMVEQMDIHTLILQYVH